MPEAKITRYLLNLDHPKGGSKAVVFTAYGYAPEDPQRLAADLAAHAHSGEAREAWTDQHGTRHVVVGEMQTPGGAALEVQTVWIVRPGDPRPFLVTAYPA